MPGTDHNRVGVVDVTHTSHTTSNTGIQRVTRNLSRQLGARMGDLSPITFDPFQGRWRGLTQKEADCLDPKNEVQPSSRRRPRWTSRQRVLGWTQRLAGARSRDWFRRRRRVDFVLFPEIYSPGVQAQISEIARTSHAARVAVFHDAIAWKFPGWATPKTVARYPDYMESLAAMDGIVAVSQASLSDLEEFWRSRGIPQSAWPARRVVHLGADNVTGVERNRVGERPIVLCVATLEPRKNHLALLSAAAYLWSEGMNFELRLIGGLRREDGAEVVDAIERFRARGFPLVWDGALSDFEVEQAYADADFVAYPSLYEGYGLPVVEAMAHGKAVLTTRCGSLAEVVEGGGCLVLDNASASAIAAGLRALLDDKALRNRLAREVQARKQRTWYECAAEVKTFIEDCVQEKQEALELVAD